MESRPSVTVTLSLPNCARLPSHECVMADQRAVSSVSKASSHRRAKVPPGSGAEPPLPAALPVPAALPLPVLPPAAPAPPLAAPPEPVSAVPPVPGPSAVGVPPTPGTPPVAGAPPEPPPAPCPEQPSPVHRVNARVANDARLMGSNLPLGPRRGFAICAFSAADEGWTSACAGGPHHARVLC